MTTKTLEKENKKVYYTNTNSQFLSAESTTILSVNNCIGIFYTAHF